MQAAMPPRSRGDREDCQVSPDTGVKSFGVMYRFGVILGVLRAEGAEF